MQGASKSGNIGEAFVYAVFFYIGREPSHNIEKSF